MVRSGNSIYCVLRRTFTFVCLVFVSRTNRAFPRQWQGDNFHVFVPIGPVFSPTTQQHESWVETTSDFSFPNSWHKSYYTTRIIILDTMKIILQHQGNLCNFVQVPYSDVFSWRLCKYKCLLSCFPFLINTSKDNNNLIRLDQLSYRLAKISTP